MDLRKQITLFLKITTRNDNILLKRDKKTRSGKQ